MSVIVINDALSEIELNSFRQECDLYSAKFTLDDYLNASCAIDLFEHVPLSDNDTARIHENSYFQKRWLNDGSGSSLDESTKEIIQNLLLKKLPQVLELLMHPRELFLFNEHYVVKPPDSKIVFQWHRDLDEQLQSCLSFSNVKYHSLWCPLDSTTRENGTLIVPAGTPIQSLSFSDLSSGTAVVEIPSADQDEEGRTDLQGVSGEGIPIITTAGSVVIFSSHLLHCSGANSTSHPRRVFYAQYSEAVITVDSTPQQQNPLPPPLCFAVPCHLTCNVPGSTSDLEGKSLKRKYCCHDQESRTDV
jgi:ectoine hydroxylase-related dioxygenase (phytanoyl-CoA dioxygenase family)